MGKKWTRNSEIIASAIDRIQNEMGRLEDLRSKNRNLSIIVAGAIIGFAIKEQVFQNIIAMSVGAVLTTILFWYQDYQLHKFRHGWHGVDLRLKDYIRGVITEDKYVFLEYRPDDEKNATFFSKSSSFTYVILILGALFMLFYKYILQTSQ